MDDRHALQEARFALARGDKDDARQFVARALQANPLNETAWVWLSGLVAEPSRRRHCLEKVLQINPANEFARREWAQLLDAQPEPAYVPPEPAGQAVSPQPKTGERAMGIGFSLDGHAAEGAMLAVPASVLGILHYLFTTPYAPTRVLWDVVSGTDRGLGAGGAEAAFVVITRFVLSFGVCWLPLTALIAAIRMER